MIGIFDSGSGGLTVLAALRKRAPKADVVYFGDIANAPYGERNAEELTQLIQKGIAILEDAGASEFVSACNSVSLSALQGAAGPANIIEMTRPTARALRAHAGQRMLLIATSATIRSHIYADAIGVTVLCDELPVLKLARAIEFGAPEDEIRGILREAFLRLEGKQYDGIILGCTHYPLARDIIEREAASIFGSVEILDPAEAVAEEVDCRFNTEGRGQIRFLLSKDSAVFRKRVAGLFSTGGYTIDVI